MGEEARRFGWINVLASAGGKVRPQALQRPGRPGEALAVTPEDRIHVAVHLKEPWHRFCRGPGTKSGESLVACARETGEHVRCDTVPGRNKNGKRPTPKSRSETMGTLDRLIQGDPSGASHATLGGTHLPFAWRDFGFMVRMAEPMLQHDYALWRDTNC